MTKRDPSKPPGRYREPPQESRFKKGGPSPNPTGRPKKPPAVDDLLNRLLSDKLKVGGKKMPTLEIILRQMIAAAARGERAARRDLLELMKHNGIAAPVAAQEDDLDARTQALLDAFVQRKTTAPENPDE